MLGNTVITWGGTIAPSLFGKGSRGPLYRACSSESKKRDKGQSKERDRKAEACEKREEEKNVGVHPITLGQGDSRECWGIPSCRI